VYVVQEVYTEVLLMRPPFGQTKNGLYSKSVLMEIHKYKGNELFKTNTTGRWYW